MGHLDALNPPPHHSDPSDPLLRQRTLDRSRDVSSPIPAPHKPTNTPLPLSLIPRHHSLPRDPPSILWCAPHSAIYILLTPVLTSFSDPTSLLALLTSASGYVATRIHELGDGVIARGTFEMAGNGGVRLSTWNANNHQQTWATLGAAVDALRDYMRVNGGAGARFGIFDGQHLVGEGVLGGG